MKIEKHDRRKLNKKVLFAIVGILVIKFLLQYLQKGSFKGFAIYRIILGVIVLAIAFARL